MSKIERFKERAKSLEARAPKAAADAWIEVLKLQDDEGDPNPDLAIYNRIGDLYLKLKDPAQAADYYDRAVDRYAELGFHNNAIAMCNKVLRNAPARQAVYLKLAKLYAAKGFLGEARQNFVEYAGRMQKAGRIEQAFAALRELIEIAPQGEHLREMLEEHLTAYGDASAGAVSSAPSLEPTTGTHKGSALVFLDLDEPAKGAAAGGGARRTAPPAAPSARVLPPEPEPELDTSLEIETTSLTDEAPGAAAGSDALAGLELTSADFGSVRESAPPRPSLRDEAPPPEVEPMAGLEPTASDDEDTGTPPAARPGPPKMPPLRRPAPAGGSAAPVKPVQLRRPGPPAAPTPPKRKTVVEIPPLELEPDFGGGAATSAGDDEQARVMEDVGGTFIDAEGAAPPTQRKSGHIDLGVEGIVNQGDLSSALVFDSIEAGPAGLSIADLEAQVAESPDDAEAHLALGEALVEAGQRDRGIEEMDHATGALEASGQIDRAHDLVAEILRLDPNSIRHRQKMVEFAFKGGDKPKLVDAYLELADTLLRADLPEKACAVYERVAEHDAKNTRAREALAMLAPAQAAPPEDRRVRAKDAKMTVRDSADSDGDFVDLGAMILDDAGGARDTRMTVADEEPTGDEEQDFQDMLARFKQGIDENIDETDFQSHYDLGVAFKEMGLLDEAIAEMQKALRAPEGKLRTSEALGMCFFEKGAFTVADSILRRGLELPASGDQERVGILYWLARALEVQGENEEARELYGRVFAVDIRFLDVDERVRALTKTRR